MKNKHAVIAFVERHDRKIILFSWVIVQAIFFVSNGIYTEGESIKYISQANNLINAGNFSSHNYWLYATEILVIALTLKLKTGFALIVLLQLLLNAMATLSLYKLSEHVLKDKIVSLTITLFFILNLPLQTFNFFIYTESIFYSLVILFSSFLLRLQFFTFKTFVLILLFLVLLTFTRPTGILFFPATFLYLYLKFFRHISIVFALGSAFIVMILFLWVVNIFMQSGGEFDFMLPYKKGIIICGVPTQLGTSGLEESENSLAGILHYISGNFLQFLQLAWLKTISFFGITRSYLSARHNWFIILFYYPIHLLCIAGVWMNYKKYYPEFLYLLTIILLYWLTTAVTCDDWHNRFFLTISPFMAMIGFSVFVKKRGTMSQD